MKNALEIKNLRKKYKEFLLDDISFNIPCGYICGFIGNNGAGKTTVFKLILEMALKDGGEVEILGKSGDDYKVKENLGILLEQPQFQNEWTAHDIEKTMRLF
ncbi:MAG: ATP-binding cassette domain-containing protein, partial [Lachnospiraceae bacterium]|nr:ATP-binding cassette domain-containing protein [Lachnospiraceae bacterium]